MEQSRREAPSAASPGGEDATLTRSYSPRLQHLAGSSLPPHVVLARPVLQNISRVEGEVSSEAVRQLQGLFLHKQNLF